MTDAAPFDPAAYYKAGHMPWTFFAYPRSLADKDGMPPDNDAKRLLNILRCRGLEVGVWVETPVPGTSYFACPKDEIERLHRTLTALEAEGQFEQGFCSKRTDYLFSVEPNKEELARNPRGGKTLR